MARQRVSKVFIKKFLVEGSGFGRRCPGAVTGHSVLAPLAGHPATTAVSSEALQRLRQSGGPGPDAREKSCCRSPRDRNRVCFPLGSATKIPGLGRLSENRPRAESARPGGGKKIGRAANLGSPGGDADPIPAVDPGAMLYGVKTMLTRNKTAGGGETAGGLTRDGFRGRGSGRIRVALGTLAVVAVVMGFYGAWTVSRLQRRGEAMLSQNVASIRAAEELETVVREIRYRLKRFLETGDGRQLRLALAPLDQGEESLRETESLAESTRESDLARRTRRGYRMLAEELRGFELASDRQDWGDTKSHVLHHLADEVIPNRILASLNKYVEHNDEAIDDGHRRIQGHARRLMFGMAFLGAGGGAAGLFAGFWIARHVDRTIFQLSVPVRDAAGKLNEVVGPIEVSGRMGFEELQSLLQTVSHRVTTVVERFRAHERDALRSEQLAAVGQLAAGMAHELRNPLTAVKAVTQLASHPGELSERDLELIRYEVGRLEQSVQRFLDFARPPTPTKRPIDVAELADETLDLLSRNAELKGVRLVRDFDHASESPPDGGTDQATEGVGYRVPADAGQLRQVILNLVLNGCDAANRGGEVRLSLRRGPRPPRRSAAGPDQSRDPVGDPNPTVTADGTDAPVTTDAPVPTEDRGGVWLLVSDTGPGPAADVRSRIFDPFVSTKETGLGLGLSICRRIIDAHGGRIECGRTARGRTEFRVWLPRNTSASIGEPAGRNATVAPAIPRPMTKEPPRCPTY